MFNKEFNISFLLEKDLNENKEKEEENIIYNINSAKANLNPKYTFESFIVGDSNKFAYMAAVSVAENPGKTYNPLFLYGGVGLGKTHLLHAVGNYLNEHRPDLNVLYVTCEKFTNDFVESIRSGKDQSNLDFRDKYRSVDVLMIDDIQFISNNTMITI